MILLLISVFSSKTYLIDFSASLSIFLVTNGVLGFVKPTSAYPWSSVILHNIHVNTPTFLTRPKPSFLHENNVWFLLSVQSQNLQREYEQIYYPHLFRFCLLSMDCFELKP